MVLGVLIIACCVVFAVWRLGKTSSPSPPMYPGDVAAHTSLWCYMLAIWSWLKPRSVTSPPMLPGCLPLIGHAHKLIGDAQHMWKFEKMIYNFALQNNDLIQFRLGTHSLFVLTDPDDSLTIANNCLEKPYIYSFANDMYGNGLVSAKVKKWKPHRKLLNPAFNLHVLHSFVSEYSKQAKILVSQLASEAGKDPFDVQPYLIDNVLRTAYLWCYMLAIWSWLKPRSVTSPPMLPGCLPLIGHAHKLIGDAQHMWKFEKMIYNFALQNNDLIQFRLGTHSLFVLTDPDDSLTIANNCLEKPYIYSFANDMYGNGLISAKVKKWKPHRKLLNPAFNLHVLHSFVSEYSKQAKILVSQLASEAGKDPFDVQPYLIDNVLRTAYRTTFGSNVDENSETLNTYSHVTDEVFMMLFKRLQKIWLHLFYIYKWTANRRKYDELVKILKGITELVITNRKLELKTINQLNKAEEPATESFVSLLDRMLELADKENAFTDDEIREHLDTLVAAAYDTTATVLSFTLILIGSHRDVQERMFQELQEVLGDEERDINRHDLPKLVYMEAVIKETLRLYPPGPRFARTSDVEVKLKNYTLPANCTYLISVYGLHRHAMWGPDKDLFKPDRWLDPARLPKNPNYFAGFSLGKRNCIGKLYGMMAIKTTLVHILRQYRIYSDIENLETRCDIILKPVAGHLISLESRV